jgi:hypothetical protein
MVVRCSDCGFLALRNEFTGHLAEAERKYRLTGDKQNRLKPGLPPGRLHVSATSFEWPFADLPTCFVQAYDLPDEYHTFAVDTVLEVLRVERDCDVRGLFTPWQQGFTPKEHREMRDRQLMLEREDKRDWEMRQREDARDKAQAAAHNEEMETLRDQHRAHLLSLAD